MDVSLARTMGSLNKVCGLEDGGIFDFDPVPADLFGPSLSDMPVQGDKNDPLEQGSSGLPPASSSSEYDNLSDMYQPQHHESEWPPYQPPDGSSEFLKSPLLQSGPLSSPHPPIGGHRVVVPQTTRVPLVIPTVAGTPNHVGKRPKWTKASKYKGYQSTLDSTRGMRELHQCQNTDRLQMKSARKSSTGIHTFTEQSNSRPCSSFPMYHLCKKPPGTRCDRSIAREHQALQDMVIESESHEATGCTCTNSVYPGMSAFRNDGILIPGVHYLSLTDARILYNFICRKHHDLYLILGHPETPQYLKDLAKKYGMSSRLWEDGIKAYVEHLGRQKDSNLAEMRAFLGEAHDMMVQFIKDIPSMEDEFRKIIANIKEYDKNLERLQRETAQSKTRKKCKKSASNKSDLAQAGKRRRVSPSISKEDAKLCPLHGSTGSVKAAEATAGSATQLVAPNTISRSASGGNVMPTLGPSKGDNVVSLPEYVISTITGWLWYGQAITIQQCYEEGFNMYCMVYSALSLAGEWVRENLKPAFNRSSFWNII